MMTVDFDPETFRNFADICGKLLSTACLFSRNLIHLTSVLISAHADKSQFLDSLLRLIKFLIKDLLALERSLKEKKSLPKNNRLIQDKSNPETDSSFLNIKRSILYQVGKLIVEIDADQFRKNLIDVLIKNNQTYKFENNNNNHPIIKNILKLLGVGTIVQVDDKQSDRNPNKKLLKPLGNELVPFKQEERKLDTVNINFKSRNREEIKKVRDNFLKEQEIERVKYIEIVSQEAKIREKNKMMFVRKKMRQQELLLQPLDSNGFGEPQNPTREK